MSSGRYLHHYWTCENCKTLNYMSNSKCAFCDEPNPDNQPFGLANLAILLLLALVLTVVGVFWIML